MSGRALLLVISPTLAGALAGVGLAWLLVTVHAISPDNPLAGLACGFGGSISGGIAGMIALARSREI